MTRKELTDQILAKGTFLCVGLDTDENKLPDSHDLLNAADPIFEFNKAIVDATAPYCVAYKINVAFYEAAGIRGLTALKRTVEYLAKNYTHHFVIVDAKRGDIGNTSAMYARAFLDNNGLGADAVTVAPYMGKDSVTPFLEYPGKWVILLALTSNEGSTDFQLTTDSDGERMFERVVRLSRQWGTEDNMMYVVGATRAELVKDIRTLAPRHFLLVPGVGAQGGRLHEVCRYGLTDDGGLLVNSSRGIIYAGGGDDYAEQASQKAMLLRDEMLRELDAFCQ